MMQIDWIKLAAQIAMVGFFAQPFAAAIGAGRNLPGIFAAATLLTAMYFAGYFSEIIRVGRLLF